MEQRYSSGVRILLYILSFLFPIIGLIVGIVFLTKEDEESKSLGKTCLIITAVSFVISCCLCGGLGAMSGFLGGGNYSLLPVLGA